MPRRSTTRTRGRLAVIGLLLAAALAAVPPAVAGAALSGSAARTAALRLLDREIRATDDALGGRIVRCIRRSSTRIDCRYSILRGAGARVETRCTAAAVVTLDRGRVRARSRGERCVDATPAPPPPPTPAPTPTPPPPTSSFFDGALVLRCQNPVAQECRDIQLEGSFDAAPRGRQLEAFRVVMQSNGGTPVRIGDAICPSPLSDEIRTTTVTEGDTIVCQRSSPSAPTMGSSERLLFRFTVNQALAEGAQAQVFGKPVGGAFEGPIVATLDTNTP